MKTVRTIPRMRSEVGAARARGDSIGLVPTMGALHEGHMSLIRRARMECRFVVVSIFVNQRQFDSPSDFHSYLRPLEDDLAMCEAAGVDAVFSPAAGEMYPEPPLTRIIVSNISERMEGAFRPGHFEGVALVVAKLFSITGECRAYFGEKDAQQLCLVTRLAADLDIPVQVVGCPTVRDADGLAMSSRNVRLSADDRDRALCLPRALFRVRDSIEAGRREVASLLEEGAAELRSGPPDSIDYLEVVDAHCMSPVERVESEVLVCGAIRISGTRLIDNVRVSVAGSPPPAAVSYDPRRGGIR